MMMFFNIGEWQRYISLKKKEIINPAHPHAPMFTKRQIWALLIPLMIEQVLNSLMGTADTMMVSNAGSAAISAVSLVDAINVLLINVFAAMATGGTIICAQYLGRRDRDEAVETGRQLLLTVFTIATAVTLVCTLLRAPLLRLIFGRVEAEVMENAKAYLLITALSYPFIAMYNAGAALFRVDGNSRLPMLISMVCNLINIAGNAVLIFGFNLGVVGAALATLISRVLSAVAVLYFLRQPRQTIVIRDYFKIRPKFSRILNILAVGIPTGIENGMFQFGKLVIQSSVSTLGTTAIAAQAMTSTLEIVTSEAPMGIGLGMMTLVGQCMGAGRVDEAKRNIKRLTAYAAATVALICGMMALLVRPITVVGGMEPAAAEMTVWMTYIICAIKPLTWPLSFIPAYGMRAAGDVRFSMMVSSCTMWLCRVVTAVVLIRVFHFGPIAVWIGMFFDWSVRSVIFTLRFKSGRWAEKKVLKEAA